MRLFLTVTRDCESGDFNQVLHYINLSTTDIHQAKRMKFFVQDLLNIILRKHLGFFFKVKHILSAKDSYVNGQPFHLDLLTFVFESGRVN